MNIDRLLGLQLTNGDRPPGSLDRADDVILNSYGAAIRRPVLRRLPDLPAASAGLYGVDDTLRALAPNGTSDAGLYPTVFLDKVDATSLAGRVQAVRLASGRRAVWVESNNGADGAIHVTNALPGVDETGSRVTWPGSFGTPRGLISLYGRLYSLDATFNRLRYSGLDDPDVNGGRGYVTAWDEAEPVGQHGGSVSLGQGSSEPQALAEYRGRAAIFLRQQIQTWLPGPDGPDSLDQVVSGPGSRYPGTVQAVSGSLIYADSGSWVRDLGTDGATEGAKEGSLGEPVAAMTAWMVLPGSTSAPVGQFSRSLSCFLLSGEKITGRGAFLDTPAGTYPILCLSMTPGGAVHGWTRWNLPLPGPVTAMAEVRGVVYIRCAPATPGQPSPLFYLDPNGTGDEVTTGVYQAVNPVVQLAEIAPSVNAGLGTSAPVVTRIGLTITGDAYLRPITEGRERTEAIIRSKFPSPSWRFGNWPGWSIGVRVRGVDAGPGWAVEAIALE